MAILPIPPDIQLEPATDILKTKSVKQLPQSKEVPTIYTKAFQSTQIIDTNLVIRSIREDISKLYEVLDSPVVEEINTFKLSVYTILQDHEDRLEILEAASLDYESRLAALEAYHP